MNSISVIGSDCCGCGACRDACRAGAIEFSRDKEGFYAPVVDESKCVSCGVCLKTCPQNRESAGGEPLAVYAALAKSDDILRRSSSGGLFSVAGRIAVDNGAEVYGAALNGEDNTIEFTSAVNDGELKKLCGSKYAQSAPIALFREIDAKLKSGKSVLFSGCPCQVAALRNFVGDVSGLTAIDIVCHGAPSPAVFQAYMAWLEKKEGAKITDYRFRTKERGWGMTLGYSVNGQKKLVRSPLDPYYSTFINGLDLRKSCYKCRYATKSRQGDITVGDYWGILKEHPGFYTEKGVSVILVNTKKGEALFESMKPLIDFLPSKFEKAAAHNRNLLTPSAKPASRDNFFDGMDEMSQYEFVQTRMVRKPNLKTLVKAFTPPIAKRVARRLLMLRRAK